MTGERLTRRKLSSGQVVSALSYTGLKDSDANRSRRVWSGALRINDTIARIEGIIGSNATHRHLALQVSIGLDGQVEVELAKGLVLEADAVLVGSMTAHRLGPVGRRVRSWYVEPRCALGRTLAARLRRQPAVMLSAKALEGVGLGSDEPVDQTAEKAHGRQSDQQQRLVAHIKHLETSEFVGRPADWAAALHISARRLRLLCLAVYGIPPSRLVQWLQLRRAAALVADGCGFAEAAHAAGYADQAHFTRRLTEWFGVSPRRGLGSLQISITPGEPAD